MATSPPLGIHTKHAEKMLGWANWTTTIGPNCMMQTYNNVLIFALTTQTAPTSI